MGEELLQGTPLAGVVWRRGPRGGGRDVRGGGGGACHRKGGVWFWEVKEMGREGHHLCMCKSGGIYE